MRIFLLSLGINRSDDVQSSKPNSKGNSSRDDKNSDAEHLNDDVFEQETTSIPCEKNEPNQSVSEEIFRIFSQQIENQKDKHEERMHWLQCISTKMNIQNGQSILHCHGHSSTITYKSIRVSCSLYSIYSVTASNGSA